MLPGLPPCWCCICWRCWSRLPIIWEIGQLSILQNIRNTLINSSECSLFIFYKYNFTLSCLKFPYTQFPFSTEGSMRIQCLEWLLATLHSFVQDFAQSVEQSLFCSQATDVNETFQPSVIVCRLNFFHVFANVHPTYTQTNSFYWNYFPAAAKLWCMAGPKVEVYGFVLWITTFVFYGTSSLIQWGSP